jgi:cysteine desulfurase / selenocysteine lyase
MNIPFVPIIPTSPRSSEESRRLMRRQISAADNWAYFDHAAVSPIPKASAEAMRQLVCEAEEDGDYCWPRWAAAAQRLRLSGAELLHCQPSEIALIPNTTFGINLIAQGMRWEERRGTPRNVVVLENEFSSNLLPWNCLTEQGIEVRHVPVAHHGVVDLNQIRSCIDANTQLVSASWVGYLSGYRLDLAELCEMVHEAGAKLFVDAIQGLGVFPCNLSELDIDFLAADGHKWMMGPEGAGLLFIREKNLDLLKPMMVGWGSLEGAHTFSTHGMSLKKNASRFEGGSANHIGQIGLERSIRMLLDLGCHTVTKNYGTETSGGSLLGETVLETAAILEEQLRAVGAVVHRDQALAMQFGSQLSGIVCFEIPDRDPSELRNRLIREKVMLSVRHGRLRAAVHAYNDINDIDRLIQVIRENDSASRPVL